MGFKCGIVGLPNVGKSTLFNTLTRASVAAENYPFCTIDPHVGIVSVPDSRLQVIADLVQPQKVIPTVTEFVDIAGLVKGAADGEGLGNQFLAHIRETQAILHVVRCFENPDIVHVAGKIDPLEDIDTIQTELMLADLATVEKSWDKIARQANSGDKVAILEKAALDAVKQQLDDGKPVRGLPEDIRQQECVQKLQLLTAKPVLYIANVDEEGFENNPFLAAVQQHAASEQAKVVAICAAIESELVQLDEEERMEFLNAMHLEEPGLDRVIRTGYTLLNLHTFFTAGPKEVRAWTIPIGARAPQAAGSIHTDFEKGFIRAEVVSYDDFVQYQGEHGAKEAGRWRLEGKDYVMQDGDVVHFRFNV